MSTPTHRPVWAEIDLGAVRANVRAFGEVVAPAQVCAVVKADGYGHGAVAVGRAALAGGACALAVALVEEGVQLRDAGIDAPILVLSEPVPEAAESVIAYRLTPVVYTTAGIDALAKAVAAHHGQEPLGVHVKVDTGMHRVGCTPAHAADFAAHVVERPELVTCRRVHALRGRRRARQRLHRRTAPVLRSTCSRACVRARLPTGTVHACNSAATLTVPAAHYDLVRIGIGVYGIAPAPALSGRIELVPAMSVKARVSHVQQLPAGARISYGLRYEIARPTRVVTVPVGYADGVPRELGLRGGEVLIRGHPPPDRRDRDDGPADGRRRGHARRGRRRGRLDRPARRGADHGGGLGDADGHHRVHDRVRHRPARPSRLHGRRVRS